MPDLVIVETHDRVRTITLNRPEARNARRRAGIVERGRGQTRG